MTDSQAAFDIMAAEVTDRKEARAAILTPVEGERSPLALPAADGAFPFDSPDQAVTQVALQLRREATTLIAVADALDALHGADTQTAIAPPAQPAPPVQPDPMFDSPQAEFERKLAAKTAAAQAEVFKAADESEDPPAPAGGWTCPTHGADTLKQLTSRKGRAYLTCACGEFEK
jgi:hypothetical protein